MVSTAAQACGPRAGEQPASNPAESFGKKNALTKQPHLPGLSWKDSELERPCPTRGMGLAPAALTLGSPVSRTRFGDLGLTAQATRCSGPARLASGGGSPERAGLRLGSPHSLGHQHNSAPRDARPACGKQAQLGSSDEGLAWTRGSRVAEGEPPRGLGGPGSPRSGEHSWVAQGALEGVLQRRGGHRGNPRHQHKGRKRNT